jgi:hypothetical protein
MAPLQEPPSLGSAASFAVLGAAVDNSGPSRVSGNLGAGSGSALSGFPPGAVSLGDVFRDDVLTRAAQKDLAETLEDLGRRSCGTTLTGGLGGRTLAQGVYCFATAAELSGTFTLDAAGSTDAVWVFKIAGALTTAPEFSVVAINGAQRGNVYWQIGDSATLGSGTTFVGNILALRNITLGPGTSVAGRALSRTGIVTLDTSDVSLCCDAIRLSPVTLPEGALSTAYSATLVATGGAGSYTFALVSGSLPPGLALSPAGTLSGVPATAGRFRFAVRVTDSSDCSRVRPYEIGVCPAIVVSLPATKLPACVPFSERITAAGGSGSYLFSSSGPLPPGLSLSSTGVLSGTPATAGTYAISVTAVDSTSGCTGTGVITVEVFCPAISIRPDTATLPDGFLGKDYRETISAEGLCGPYTFSSTGLPDGLTLSPLTGVLSGVPSREGEFTFIVKARSTVAECAAERTYTIRIGCPEITIAPATLPNGTVGALYSELFSASGGTPAYTIALFERRSLPVEFTVAGNALSGTPLAPGRYELTVRATDAAGCVSAPRLYELAICPLVLSPAELPDAATTSEYEQRIEATGGSGSYEFSVSAGALPPAFTLDPATGVISGTASMAGLFAFTVTARDKITSCTGSEGYTIRVICVELTISPAVLPSGIVGTFYEESLAAAGGAAPIVFTIVSGALPPGLEISSGGTISGTPTTAGSYTVGVRATDAAGCKGEIAYCTFDISPAACPAGTTISLSPATLPNAAIGVPYSQFVTASGGTAPYTFSVIAGALPPGLSLNPATGEIFGVPTTAGSFDFTIAATDANGCLGSLCLTIGVNVTVPALSGWGLSLLCAFLAALGLTAIRRIGV